MDYQTTLDEPEPDLRAHLGGMVRHAIHIVDLQVRLMMADLRTARRAVITAAICGGAAMAVSTAALPVAIAGFGLLASEMTSLSVAGGLLVAALVSLIIAGILAAYAVSQLSRQKAAWESSKRELETNLAALRQALTRAPSRGPSEVD
jgi:hypothetical protein